MSIETTPETVQPVDAKEVKLIARPNALGTWHLYLPSGRPVSVMAKNDFNMALRSAMLADVNALEYIQSGEASKADYSATLEKLNGERIKATASWMIRSMCQQRPTGSGVSRSYRWS